ncbi:MAG: hypothetical protein P8100_12405 [bacterium]
MGFFYFLGQKKFYIHLLIAILLGIFIFWAALFSLDRFTRHGEVFIVPDFREMTIPQIIDQNYTDFFELVVLDSVFDNKAEKGSVVMQHPLPGARVKKGRHIYLTIVSELPEKVFMPNLKNLSLRQALVTLESVNLKAGTLEYVNYFARNAVVEQLFEGEPVEPATELIRGTTIDLQVGKGDITATVPIPLLIAMKQSEAKRALNYAYLNLGKEYFLDGDDTAHARVYKTDPSPLDDTELEPGETVRVWYRSDEYFDFDSYLAEFTKDSLSLDSLVRQHVIRKEQE